MLDQLPQILILFLVIFDPLASIVVFTVATKSMADSEKNRIAVLAVVIASLMSLLVLLFGNFLLHLFGITLEHFKIAGGIILIILGIEMTLGYPLTNPSATKESSVAALASLIATPMLTGPAAITAIIISSNDFGFSVTFVAILAIMLLSLALLLVSARLYKRIGDTPIQVMSTILGMITLAWGVKFILEGLG